MNNDLDNDIFVKYPKFTFFLFLFMFVVLFGSAILVLFLA